MCSVQLWQYTSLELGVAREIRAIDGSKSSSHTLFYVSSIYVGGAMVASYGQNQNYIAI